MKIDSEKLVRQLSALPDAQKKHIRAAISKSVVEGAQVAGVLAPERSGETKRAISAEMSLDGMSGMVRAIHEGATRDEKDRAYSIEAGRKKGDKGTTQGSKHMSRTRAYLGQKFRGRVSRAVRRAAKEVASGG